MTVLVSILIEVLFMDSEESGAKFASSFSFNFSLLTSSSSGANRFSEQSSLSGETLDDLFFNNVFLRFSNFLSTENLYVGGKQIPVS